MLPVCGRDGHCRATHRDCYSEWPSTRRRLRSHFRPRRAGVTMHPMTEPVADDAGLGLIELIVALLVSSVVLIAVATILVNSWLTQQDVTSTTEATTRGQLIGQNIERAMRNA